MTTSQLYEPELIINPNTRKIFIPSELYNICVATDDNSEIIKIKIPRYFDNCDFSNKECSITYNNALKERGTYKVTEIDILEDFIVLNWCISNHVTKKAGKIYFVVEFKSSNAEHNKTYSWSTLPAELNVMQWLDSHVTYTNDDNSSIEYIRQNSHVHHNMEALNKITNAMIDLFQYVKPAYDNIMSHISNILNDKGDDMHVPKGGEVGQVLGRIYSEPDSDDPRYAWIDQEAGSNVEIPENVSSFKNDAEYQTKENVEQIVNEKISNKVDKINGKGLSTNDYTDYEKMKVSRLPNIIFSTAIPTELDENTICFIYED